MTQDTRPSTSLGFIILRHVNSERTNEYWILSYTSIRKLYPENRIIIIDDNSDTRYLKSETLYKTTVIQSEYPGRGELLPYYYYLHNKLFDRAVIIHDSVFMNKKIDTDVDGYRMLWAFGHDSDNIKDETRLLDVLDNAALKRFYENKRLWRGCFGAMSIITHKYLAFINKEYDISKLLGVVLNKQNRKSFERVFACLLQKHGRRTPLLGHIHNYCKWGVPFEDRKKYMHLPLTKVWSGR